MSQADAQLISDSILGEDLTRSECETLSEIVRHRKLAQDEVLFEPGTIDHTLYILIDGKLDINKVIGENKTININVLKQGAMIGELSFLDGNAHSMQLKARKPSEVIMMSRVDFEGLLLSHPKLVFDVMRSILRFSHHLQRKMMEENIEMKKLVQFQYRS